jgi:hypothetical protein
LLAEVSDEDFVPYQLPGRICCNKFEEFIEKEKVDPRTPRGKTALRKYVETVIPDAQRFVDELADFVHTEAKLPASDKNYLPTDPIEISTEQSRAQIIDYLRQIRPTNTTADLAFYAYRDMESCDWTPFIKAAVERNPVSIRAAESMSTEEVYAWLEQMENISIYDGKRLAQPDEVANYRTADGLEKAFLLANVILTREPGRDTEIIADGEDVVLKGPVEHRFASQKGLQKHVSISATGDISITK